MPEVRASAQRHFPAHAAGESVELSVPGPGRWLGNLTISRKLAAIVVVDCLVVASALMVVFSALNATDAIRAYVGAEGLWSKAQKSAVYHLSRYTTSADPDEFAAYQRNIDVILGYRQARFEMEKPDYDFAAVEAAWLRGGTAREDVPHLLSFFRRFRDVGYFSHAVDIWIEGDAWIDKFRVLAQALQQDQIAGPLSESQESSYLEKIHVIETALTPLEDEFGRTMGMAARWGHGAMTVFILVAALILLGLGQWFSMRVARDIRRGIARLHDGAERVARGEMQHAIIPWCNDELGALVASFNEMTRRRHAVETALDEQRNFLQVTLENLSEAVVACDTQGKSWLINRAARRLSGFDSRDMPAEHWANAHHWYRADGKTLLPKEETPLFRALRGEHVVASELVIAPQGQAPYSVLANAQVLATEGGQTLGAVVTMSDVTQRKQAEADLAEHAQMLEKANAELQHSNAELRRLYHAEAASEAKSRFLSTISHEIRTPLHAILGLLELLAKEQLTPDQTQKLQLMAQSGLALQQLINDVLDFSKIESGRVDIENIPYDIREVAGRVRAELEQEIQRKKLDFIETYQTDFPARLIGDAGRIHQILLNLTSNAVKFTDSGGRIELKFSLLTAAKAGPRLHVEVTDTGIGMSAEVQEKVFESFEQGEDSITRRFGGTGLGLAISKGLVERMGGEIGCESKIGRGSNFWFDVQAEIASSMAAGAKDQPATEKQIELDFPQGGPARILVAEDNPANRKLIGLQLARYNCECTVVEDGETALARAREGDFHMLITDVQMPRMSGYELSRRIRSELGELKDQLVIIGLTASAQDSTLEKCREAGMDDCMFKPLSLAQLDAKLKRWLPATI